MDHRHGMRWPLVLPALIHGPDGGLAAGRTRDISADGVFIEIGAEGYRPNDCVEVVVLCDSGPGHGVRCLRVPAMVVHRQVHGVGVMYRSVPEDAQEVLSTLVHRLPASMVSPFAAHIH